MSDFTDFFPVSGGSGVGSGIPINGYFPFLTTVPNNLTGPPGYNSTTGLYTHPDGTYWIKSGNTINSPDGTYPSAIGSPGSLYSGVQFTMPFANRKDMCQFGANFLILDSTDTLTEYTTLGVATGFSFSVNPQAPQVQSVTFDGTNIWVNDISNKSVFKYTSLGVYTGFSFSTATQGNQSLAITSGNGNIYVHINNSNIFEYTSAGVYTGFNFSTSTQFASYPASLDFDGTTFTALESSSPYNVYTYTSAGVYTGFNFYTPPASGATGIVYDGTYYWILSNGDQKVYQFDVTLASTSNGDPVARTDTDTSQPLFVRVG